MAIVFSKVLTKTDIEKRLSVQTVKKTCFLDFRGKHQVGFEVVDENGKVWRFFCSKRKKEPYPKPVLSRGWLQFVRSWRLAIGDAVIIHRKQGKSGKEHYRIKVIRRATLPSSVLSPLVQNQEADTTMAVASYSSAERDPTVTNHILDQPRYSNIEEQPSTTSNSTYQATTYDGTEELHNQPVTDRIGFKFEFIRLEPHIKDREAKLIDFLELGSQEQREKEQPSFRTPPTTSSTAPYFNFFDCFSHAIFM